ncbi:Uncharacterised protein [Mycobacteroides abscessus subsp. abscessus]|nr:Uncharacterised protein [Mycobacteroides abscessus subsp. abscessus]
MDIAILGHKHHKEIIELAGTIRFNDLTIVRRRYEPQMSIDSLPIPSHTASSVWRCN